ncbi:O-antigen polymerase [Flavobacterium chungbukense]|uniref:Oligosaccharide repeat unit polymerase n=1 Tax=Flavobacterium chungbukense TaxID=877464 RepID=A0ABP7XJW5_9FLAO|nr:O-antigen polymerase [Flavobacterium chungbukense]MCC4922968.1 oligosaccharide repeat unit polymerase [Flavobacterium chungbukense]
MILLTAIFLLLLAFLGYLRKKSFIAPTFLSPLSWGIVLFLYGTLDHGMNNLSNEVLVVILIWNLSLLIGAWFFSEVSLSFSILKEESAGKAIFNKSIRNLYYWISVLGSFPLLLIAYKQGTTLGQGSFFFNLRLANTGIVETEYNYGIWQYVFTFAFVSFLIELFTYQKGENKKRIVILIIINLLLSLITMAKSSFFFLFLSVLFSIMFRRKIPIRNLFIVFSILIGILSLLQLLRAGDESNVISSMFYTYIFGGIPALDQLVKGEMYSVQWGQMTMRFFRLFYGYLGGEPLSPNGMIFANDVTEKGYIYVPFPTNVFTVIGPFWLDFGYKGIAIFSFIIGSISGYLYRLALKKRLWAVISYSFFACTLVLQFFGEYVFTNLSYTIQIIALTLFAFKFKYIIKW